MKTKLTHPADGIYATSVSRLKKLAACSLGIHAFMSTAFYRCNYPVHGDWNIQVPITLDLTTDIFRRYPGAAHWILDAMYVEDLITISDYLVWRAQLEWGLPDTNSVALMDLLLIRAKREGLVS